MTPENKVLKLAMVTNELVLRAQRRATEKVASVNQLGTLIPKTVKALVDNGRVYPHQAEKLAESLLDHSTTVQLLGQVAAHRNSDEATLGQPVKVAAAPANRVAGQPISDYSATEAGRRFEERILGRASAK